MTSYRLNVVVERDDDGYVARCVDLQGCYAQASTYEDAMLAIEDAIRLHIEDRLERGEALPVGATVSLTTVEVEV